jgi:hypothetical protein
MTAAPCKLGSALAAFDARIAERSFEVQAICKPELRHVAGQ